MKKILVSAALLLLLFCLLISCSAPKGPIREYYPENSYSYFDTPSFYGYRELTQFVDWDIHYLEGHDTRLLWFSFENTKHAIYDVVADRTVLELEGDTFDFQFAEFENGTHVFWMINASDNTLTLYQADGTAVFTKPFDQEKDEPPTLTRNLLCYGSSYYRVLSDGTLCHAFDRSPVTKLPDVESASIVAGNYYLQNQAPAKNAVFVYNSAMRQIAYYEAPSYATSVQIVILNDGNLLVQYLVELTQDAEEYDFWIGEQKYDLVSLIFDVEDGSEKELALDYLIKSGRSRADWQYSHWFGRFTDDVLNALFCYRIENGRVAGEELQVLSVSNDGTEKKRLNDLVPRQGGNFPVAVSPTRYTLQNNLGQVFFLNERGEVLFELEPSAVVKESFIYYENAVYDHDLNLLHDYGEEMDVIKVYDNCILLFGTESENTYLFANGKSQALITKVGGLVLYLWEYNEYFCTYNPGTKNVDYFRIYNDRGDRVFYVASPWIIRLAMDDGVLIVGGNDDKKSDERQYHYYRLS